MLALRDMQFVGYIANYRISMLSFIFAVVIGIEKNAHVHTWQKLKHDGSCIRLTIAFFSMVGQKNGRSPDISKPKS